MMGVNRVTLVGNLGADPDVKKTASGKTVTLFNLATSRSWINREGQKTTAHGMAPHCGMGQASGNLC